MCLCFFVFVVICLQSWLYCLQHAGNALPSYAGALCAVGIEYIAQYGFVILPCTNINITIGRLVYSAAVAYLV